MAEERRAEFPLVRTIKISHDRPERMLLNEDTEVVASRLWCAYCWSNIFYGKDAVELVMRGPVRCVLKGDELVCGPVF